MLSSRSKSPLVMGDEEIPPFQEDVGATPLPVPTGPRCLSLPPSSFRGIRPLSYRVLAKGFLSLVPWACLRPPESTRRAVVILRPFFRGHSMEPHQALGRFPGLAKAALTPGCALRQSLPKPVHESQNRVWNRRETAFRHP